MPTTAKEIADRLGVSRPTVSRILSNKPGASHSPETRRRVLAAAKEMNYHPNIVARSLAKKRTDIIGFYCGYGSVQIEGVFLVGLLNGLLDGCELLGKDVLLHNLRRSRSPEAVYAEIANGKVDGLVLITPPNDRLVELLAESSLPAIVIADAVPNLPSVVIDDIGGSRMLAERLFANGHRHIMYRLMKESAIPSISVRRRLAAFREFAEANGMSIVQTCEEDWAGGLSEEERSLLSAPSGERPTAAVCWHDISAYGMVVQARSMGLRVPRDLAVVGFNGVENETSLFCKLTTIRANWSDVGRVAISLLAEIMEGKEIPPETVLPVDLVEGETA